MAHCAPGDRVVCRIKDNTIVNVYEENWETESIFDVVSLYEEGYIVYLPEPNILKDSIYIGLHNHKKFNADKRFIDINAYYITDYKIIRIHKRIDGMRCAICDEFYHMATSNQENGSMVCWVCRKYRAHLLRS